MIIHLVCSPDDGGWYAEDESDRTTAVYPSRHEAWNAARRGEWDTEDSSV